MNTYARTVQSKGIKIISVDRPYSFFKLVDGDFGKLTSLRRILSQARLAGVRTTVIEELKPSIDLSEENEDIRTVYPRAGDMPASRLSFFSKSFSSEGELASISSDDFLGYAVVKNNSIKEVNPNLHWRIYESVIKSSKRPNNYIHCKQKWKCCVAGHPFELYGSLYAQQNNITNVCAHVAIRTAAATYHRTGDMSYREMNRIVGIDHKKKYATPGLSTAEMVEILEAAGARCLVGNYSVADVRAPPFSKYLYGSVESGFPVIIVFGTTTAENDYHAIPIFGHTFNEDIWVPRADYSYFRVGKGTVYIPSDSWVSMFVGHDDNWGSNFCIPRRYLQSKRTCTDLGGEPVFCPQDKSGVAHVISTFPKDVLLDPIRAEVIGADYLFTIVPLSEAICGEWGVRLASYVQSRRSVLRTHLVSGSDYVSHLARVSDWEGKSIDKLQIGDLREKLKDSHYWLVEVSVPELYPTNRRKLGEILLRSDIPATPKRDLGQFMLARIPGNFVFYDKGEAVNPSYKFVPTAIHTHIELFGCEEKQ